jgi:hypothetical protein
MRTGIFIVLVFAAASTCGCDIAGRAANLDPAAMGWDYAAAPALKVVMQFVGIPLNGGGQEVIDGIGAFAVKGDQASGTALIAAGAAKAKPGKLRELAPYVRFIGNIPGMGNAASFRAVADTLEKTPAAADPGSEKVPQAKDKNTPPPSTERQAI